MAPIVALVCGVIGLVSSILLVSIGARECDPWVVTLNTTAAGIWAAVIVLNAAMLA